MFLTFVLFLILEDGKGFSRLASAIVTETDNLPPFI